MSLRSWSTFLPPASALVYLIALILGRDVLPSGYWLNGLMLGLGVALGVASLFFLSGISDIRIGFTAVILLFLFSSIGGQKVYYDTAVQQLQNQLHTNLENSYFQSEWRNFEENDAYRAFMRRVLGRPDAEGWWAHLQTQATVGLLSSNREPDTSRGPYQRQLVLRQGWQAWFGWLLIHLSVVVGCGAGLLGISVASGSKQLAQGGPFSKAVSSQPSPVSQQANVSHSIQSKTSAPSAGRAAHSKTNANEPLLLAMWVDEDKNLKTFIHYLPDKSSLRIESGPASGGHWGHDALGGVIELSYLREEINAHNWLEAIAVPEQEREIMQEFIRNSDANRKARACDD